jgi:xanthine/uracil permease
MKSRFGGVVAGQIIALVIVCAVSSFIALVSFGGVGGVSMAAYPEQTFQFLAPVLCTDGTELQYREERYSYSRPGESTPFVECVNANGDVVKDVTGTAILAAMAASFLACFLPLCVPGGLLALIIPPIVIRKKKENQPNQPAPNLID